ncbi:MAG: periplasmic heavy metal sensor [Candidatus Margulisbacteria bacterium]|nr:periplasmic heavy metal sensor [Candidatus Margulisiibacteriota bacterium]
MKVKKLFVLFLAVIILMSGTSAIAAPKWREKVSDRFAKELGLSAEQKQSFEAGAKVVEEAIKPINEQNKELHDRIAEELKKDDPNKDVIYGYLEQISKNNTQMHFKRVEHLLEFRKELAPEQKEKLKEMGAKGPRARFVHRKPG